jgi:hypothetical protein
MYFEHVWGAYAFTGLIFLVLLYLIRPKPMDVTIPSVMFFMKDQGKTKHKAFFRKLLNNLLFLLQCLILTLLALAIMSPVANMTFDTTAEGTVIVLDVSASMQTEQGSSTRFEAAKTAARKAIRGSTSIILAENVPLLALEHGSESKAKEILALVKPKDTRTNLGDALARAGELLEEGGRISVISDFISTDGPDPEEVKTILEAKGIVVDFVNVGGKANNVGIVDIAIGGTESKVIVKNYNDNEETITLSAKFEDKTSKRAAKILLPISKESFMIPTNAGVTTLKITGQSKDDLESDNIAYLAKPGESTVKAIMISNEPNIFLKNALESSGIMSVEVAEPPVTPDLSNGEYKIIILGKFDEEKLLTGTMKQVKEQVENGAALIITHHKELASIDYENLLPFTVSGKGKTTEIVKATESQLTQDISFGSVDEYYTGEAARGSSILAVAAEDETPLILVKDKGNGKVVYYGIEDSLSGFKRTPSYPVFWNLITTFTLGVDNLGRYNQKAGKVLAFKREKKIKTPMGTTLSSKIILDNAGVYTIDNLPYAVNTLSEEESEVEKKVEFTTKKAAKYNPKKVVREQPVSFEIYLVIAAFIFIILEFAYVKMRGDL